MLSVYFGTDTATVRQTAFKAAQSLSSEPPQIITTEEYQPGQLADWVGGSSLFGDSPVTIIDTPEGDVATDLADVLEALASSADHYIVIETALLAPAKKRYAKHTDQLFEHKAEAAARFNTFAIADALAHKDKKNIWLLLQQATHAGVSPEELIGILWWQLKSIRLAAQTSSAEEAGMKPFPYQKASRAHATIPLEEAERLSHSLLTLYHQGHNGEVDLAIGLEQWVLGL